MTTFIFLRPKQIVMNAEADLYEFDFQALSNALVFNFNYVDGRLDALEDRIKKLER